MIGIPISIANSPSIGAESIIQKTKNNIVIAISQTRKSIRKALCKVVTTSMVESGLTVPLRIHDAP